MSFATKSFVKLTVSAIIVFLALALTFSYSAHAYTSDEATSKIAEADSKILQAFSAVTDATEAGANVSSLALRLNEAGGLLAKANVVFRSGDYDNATLLAEQSISLVDGVVQEAGSFKTMAESERLSRLGWAALLASVGLSLLFVVSLIGWRFVTIRCFRGVLLRKPEEVAGN